MARYTLALLSGLLASASAQGSSAPNASVGQGLHSLFVAAAPGKLFFGTATDTNLFNDTAYMNIVNNKKEFGMLVPENSQKWQPTEPTQNDFEFVNPDSVRSLAVRNTQQFRCHTLTWFMQLPDFVMTTQWTKETLTAAIQAHIANVVGHYRGACYSWDVVNEALNDNGTFRNSVFFNTLGTDYIPISFRAAAAADPNAKLYYNDFNLENNGNKTTAALGIVRLLQNAGERIDGVGFQAHMTVGQTPSRQQMAMVLNRFTSLGLEVALTELDVRQRKLPANGTAVQQQAVDYMSMIGACLDVEKCVGVIVWEFTDKYSWIPTTFPGTGAACLYDENMRPKAIHTSVSSMLARAAATGTANQVGGGGRGSGSGSGSANAEPTMAADSSSAGTSGTTGVDEVPAFASASLTTRSSVASALVFLVAMLALL